MFNIPRGPDGQPISSLQSSARILEDVSSREKGRVSCGGLFPQLGFIVTSRELQTRAVVRVGNMRCTTAEQWINAKTCDEFEPFFLSSVPGE